MNSFRRLTLWQEMTSPHLLPLLAALAPRFERVSLVTLGELDGDRASIGWNDAVPPGIERIHAPSPVQRAAALRQCSDEGDLNLLSGMKPTSWQWQVQRALILSRSSIVLMSELPAPTSGTISRLALSLREMSLAKFWGHRARNLLAFSEEAADHFVRIGIPPAKVRPFAYTPILSNARPSSYWAVKPNIVVAAKLARHKGIDILFRALALIAYKPWRLRLAGGGPMRQELEALASSLGISDRIDWLGWQPASKIPQLLADATVMVLPSRYDGWGAVVNEALGVGTPVVVSRGAGAHCLVQSSILGETIPIGDVNTLAAAIVRQLDNSSADRRQTIRMWSRKALSPEVAADYFMDCLAGGKTLPPWRTVGGGFGQCAE